MSVHLSTHRHHFLWHALFIGFCCISVILATRTVFADIRITEIMYDPQGGDSNREYIEVQNISGDSFDLATAKLVASGTTRRAINAHTGGTTMKPNEIALIVPNPSEFLENYPDYTGAIYDTSGYSLRNTGSHPVEIIVLEQGDARVLDSVTYDSALGANGTGESIHFNTDGMAFVATQSLGTIRQNTSTRSKTATNQINTLADTDTVAKAEELSFGTSVIGNTDEGPNLFIQPILLFAGTKGIFSFRYNEDREALPGEWNFGDGKVAEGREIVHTYLYPGTYTVVFTEPKRLSRDSEQVTIRQVQVIESQITVVRADATSIQITNPYTAPLSISGWQLQSGQSLFVFPENSIIGADQTIRIPFQTNRTDTISLKDMHGVRLATASAPTPPPTVTTQSTTSVDAPITPAVTKEKDTVIEPIAQEKQGMVRDKIAIETNIKEDTSEKIRRLIAWFALWLVIVIVALIPLLFMTREKKIEKKK